MKVGVLPRTHGSALFTRGETQALVATTLGTGRDAQIIDALEGERREPFMFHYNFPPFSVGETGMMGSPKRREIGHGNLARRGIAAMMPDMEKFPYVIRIVSEILESNGSSSMASVCGASLSLMDAGVPIKAPVAGVAMGLVLEGERFKVLTDILGDEDHLGDMDFKVAGTRRRHRAADGHQGRGHLGRIMKVALAQAKEGRLHILGEMNKVISSSREKMSEWAPSIITLKIDPEKIRDVIGKGGAVIRQSPKRPAPRSTSRTMARSRSPASRAPRAVKPCAHRADHGRRRSRSHLRRQGCPPHGLRRVRHHPAGPRRSRAHLAISEERVEKVRTSSRKATTFA